MWRNQVTGDDGVFVTCQLDLPHLVAAFRNDSEVEVEPFSHGYFCKVSLALMNDMEAAKLPIDRDAFLSRLLSRVTGIDRDFVLELHEEKTVAQYVDSVIAAYEEELEDPESDFAEELSAAQEASNNNLVTCRICARSLAKVSPEQDNALGFIEDRDAQLLSALKVEVPRLMQVIATANPEIESEDLFITDIRLTVDQQSFDQVAYAEVIFETNHEDLVRPMIVVHKDRVVYAGFEGEGWHDEKNPRSPQVRNPFG